MSNNLRGSEIQEFLTHAGWGEAARTPLNQDASTRRYERLRRKTETAMLMDAPPLESQPCPPGASDEQRLAMGWNAISRLAASRVEAFAALSAYLRTLGLSAPEVLDHDLDRGLALLEDLGDEVLAETILRGADETQLYAAVGDVLAAVHRAQAPAQLPYRGGEWPILDYDHLALSANVDLFVEWMPQRDLNMRMTEQSRLRWERVRENLVAKAEDFPRALILRDTHAENFIWLPQRTGLQRVGLLDFQDALHGPAGYDLVSLLRDAFISWEEEFVIDVTVRYWEKARKAGLLGAHSASGWGADFGEFYRAVEWMGLQRHLKVAGIFARLTLRDGKPKYLADAPRFIQYIRTTTSRYRELAPLLRLVDAIEGTQAATGFAFGRV